MLDISAGQRTLVCGLIRRRLPHCTAIAFGSRVAKWPGRAGPKRYSDLDIALWGLKPADDLALAHLRADLEDSALPWRVDLTDAHDLPDSLRDLVLRQGVRLQARQGLPALAE